ncbi:helix-turn-helix domain-containing protein [Streptacidiphilus cavernicola]|uniref:DUF2690 domain-containing protein n=1 Tax=Streptacidiphilus cavernicola TaxID=3342716 RepID=A0ABV6VWL9_9ACTN
MNQPPAECTRLAVELQALRKRSGLALAALAADSPYSKSSWQRYLSGQSLPPWSAVLFLCRAADQPEARARALWELAERAWSRRTATHPHTAAVPPGAAEPTGAPTPVPGAAEPPTADPAAPLTPAPAPADPPPARPRLRARIAATSGLAALLVGAAFSLAVANNQSDHRTSTGSPSAGASSGFHVGCTGTRCTAMDPGTTGCGVSPETLLHQQIPGGFGLEIRYNPLCRAAWARAWNAAPGDVLTLSIPGQPTQRLTVAHPSNLDPFVYTPLIAAPTSGATLTACIAAPSAAPRCYSTRRP